MKKTYRLVIMLIFVISIFYTAAHAHGGNITGWKDKNSSEITLYNEKYYGYHNESGNRHYHQLEWDENKQRWNIIKPAVYYDENFNKIETTANDKEERIRVKYNSSIDGDTAKFELEGEIITVRFLGINTPETVAPNTPVEKLGQEASDYTKNALQNATKIEIEYDSKADKKDKYDRHLAWIWIDDKLLQEGLILNGLAKQYMLPTSYKYAEIIQEAEEIAKGTKIGVWTDDIAIDGNRNEDENDIIEEDISFIVAFTLSCILIITILIKKVKKKKRKLE